MHSHLRSLFSGDHTVIVMGAGRSGIAATRLLLKKGLKVALYDDNPRENLRYFDETITHQNLSLFMGGAKPALNDSAALIISPGIAPDHPLLALAKAHCLPVLTETDLGFLFLPPAKILGITGTNGKSTTTAMVAHIINTSGRTAIACGNIGLPLCQVVLDHDQLDYVVLELSSFQLEPLFLTKLDGAIIINITPDHLDRHPSFEHYKAAKLRIAALLRPGAPLIMHQDLADDALACALQPTFFSQQQVFDYADLGVRGEHNQENAQAATQLLLTLGFFSETIAHGLKTFTALPHRCELVAIKNGITYINDSKGTTVASVKKALSMYEAPTHLLLGGLEKGDDFSALRTEHYPNLKSYALFGKAAETISDQLKMQSAVIYSDLTEAFLAIQQQAQPGDIVLLSPGCASFDQFNDYQHRGETFRNLVKTI